LAAVSALKSGGLTRFKEVGSTNVIRPLEASPFVVSVITQL
jgi:hypothetical protein